MSDLMLSPTFVCVCVDFIQLGYGSVNSVNLIAICLFVILCYFLIGFECRILVMVAPVPGHCLPFIFAE